MEYASTNMSHDLPETSRPIVVVGPEDSELIRLAQSNPSAFEALSETYQIDGSYRVNRLISTALRAANVQTAEGQVD